MKLKLATIKKMIHSSILYLIIFTFVRAQELQIINLNDQPILILEKQSCKLQVGNFRIIHEINMTDLETTINLLTNIVYQKINNPLSNIVKHKIKNLYSNFNQIRPDHHRKRRSINIIGSAWKWIGGSPDAQDLQIINSTMNDLVESNNIQFKINQQLGQRIQNLTGEVKKLIENKQTNELILDEIDILTTIINIDTINKILEEIQEAISWSKASIVSNKILSFREVKMIRTILEDQGIKIDLPDQAITYVNPKIAINKETLLYIIQVPELQKDESKVIQLFPLINNNSIIKSYPTFLVKHKNTLYNTIQPNAYVQKSSFITKFSDDCIQPTIMGSSSHCITQPEFSTSASFIADDILLINNAKGQKMSSNCGPDNRTMYGNHLITFSNCSVNFMNQTFSSKEITMRTSILHGAMYNTRFNHTLMKNDLASLDNRTLMNRKHIDHVYLQQYKNQIWNWSLLGGVTVSTVITITLVLFAIFYFSQVIQAVLIRNPRKKRTGKPTSKEVPTTEKSPNA